MDPGVGEQKEACQLRAPPVLGLGASGLGIKGFCFGIK